MKLTRINIIRLLATIGVVAGLSSCDNDYESVFGDSPDERAAQSLKASRDLLMSAPFGWKGSLYTGLGAGYFYYFDFNEGGNVTMLSDFNETSAGEFMDTEWSVKALQRPTLSFPTYSYIHLPADPDGDINNGVPGSGLLSDFEFAFARQGTDTLVMKGLKHQSEIYLVRATEAESEAYHNNRIQDLLVNTREYLGVHRGYVVRLPNGTDVPMALSLPYKLISFQFVEGDGIAIPTTSYLFSTEGITLREKITIGGFEIDKLVWDDANNSYYVPFAEPVVLEGVDEPFILRPPTSLFSLLGKEVVTAVIPQTAGIDPLPGHSPAFTEAFRAAAASMLAGEYHLTLQEMKFVFIPNTDQMLLVLTVVRPAGGGVESFTAQYLYSYQLRDGDILKFTQEGMDENAGLLFTDMLGILSHFDNDTFKAEYVGGGFDLIGGFFSQEEPGYYFSGYILEQ